MDYSPEFKKNFSTAYLAEEYERLSKEAEDAVSAAGADAELLAMAKEDEARIVARQAEILAEIEKIVAKEKEEESKPSAIILEFRAAAGGWKNVDTEALLRDNYASRAISSRPPGEE